ncbi:uncharacterized protein PAC_14576 [Phialocephala subalpina]|uniref:Uncharacterized protein n=1 Tax=Phialocephala subalpina TaxID=576137 RepID=A0A1L7XI39_9HELO|nr:uncharacterized protein PAC_14576 [Phialocephala subalpina]
MKLPASLLGLIFTIAQRAEAQSQTDPTQWTYNTSLPTSITPLAFLTQLGSMWLYNGTFPISASSLSSPGSTIQYLFGIAVRDAQTTNKPHFSSSETLIYLNGTEGMATGSGLGNQSVVEGWSNCLLFFRNVTASATSAGQNDDGTCGSTLGATCVSDLTQAVKMGTGGNSTGSCEDLVIENLPSSCQGKIEINGTNPWLVKNLTYNNQSYYPLLEVESPLHPWDSETFNEEARRRIWPVLWYQTLNEAGSSIFNGSFANETVTGMGCLRATTNYTVSSDASNVARSLGGEQQWLVVMGLAVWTAWNLS